MEVTVGPQAARTVAPRHLVRVGEPATPRTAPTLSCRRLRHLVDGRVLVDDVSFDVEAGEAVALVGPGAAGKSTVVRLVCGLARPEAGDVLLDGAPIAGMDRQVLARRIGYVARSIAPLPTESVTDTVAFWSRVIGLPRPVRADRVAEVLARVGITDHADRRVDRCTGGVLRELSLAVALLGRPRLLVLDEPTAGVCPDSGKRLLGTLRRLRDDGVAVLCAARTPEAVADLCTRVVVLDRGRLPFQRRRPERRASPPA